ncbi:MAG: RNA-splicing ligase RtcB [Actinobacteria bacterium]|nr:RNA-splicing ligase RtcB [Actinomycetota bacterium]
MATEWTGPLEQIDSCRYLLPRSYKPGMRVDGLIYADSRLLPSIKADRALDQVANVAFLPGIQTASLAMPDIHWGYGFCIGGVAATDPEADGVISPGGVGYDINCGVRLVRTTLLLKDVQPRIPELTQALFSHIPCGVGRTGRIKFDTAQQRHLLTEGAAYLVQRGFGVPADLEHTESHGCLADADPHCLTPRAQQRGQGQCGTLGAGNHFIEIQTVDEIYDSRAAEVFGLALGQITVMIHSGSRGLGYQVCDDSVRSMAKAPEKYGIDLPDRQLVCAPVNSPEGRRYLAAMAAAANYAWANRQMLMHLVRQTFAQFLSQPWQRFDLNLIYDVTHNIAKFETYEVAGQKKMLCVHRKGATRSFGPGHPELPADYRTIGQPVIIPGDMGRNSYLLVGQKTAELQTFGSTCHGAGRLMSRGAAIRSARGRDIRRELAAKGITALARSRHGLDEEQPSAYKDVNLVVDIVHNAGLSKKVCRFRPLGVIKG